MDKKISEHKISGIKPRVMLIPDAMSWILGTWAKEIVKWNSERYEFVVFPMAEIWEREKLFISLLEEVDVVHCLTQSAFGQIRAVVDKAGHPHLSLISTIHHIDERTDVETCLMADRIMVVCRKYLDELVQKGVPKEKMVLIYNGVDTDFFSPKNKPVSRKTLGIPSQVFTIGLSCNAKPDHFQRKGIDIFIKVIARLCGSLKTDIHVMLTGPGWGDIITTFPSNNLHTHYFPFLPSRQMPEFYSALDVYLVTSRVEGGPVPLLEAMSCGTPVVTTPVGTALDFIKDGVNGLIVPIEDVESIAGAIQKIYRGEVLRERLGSAGRETILKNLQWGDTVSVIHRLYGHLDDQTRITRNRITARSLSKLNARLIRRDIARWEKRFDMNPPLHKTCNKAFRGLIKVGKALQKELLALVKR